MASMGISVLMFVGIAKKEPSVEKTMDTAQHVLQDIWGTGVQLVIIKPYITHTNCINDSAYVNCESPVEAF